MSKMKALIVGLTIVSLLAVGLVAVAGNGYSGNTEREPQLSCDLGAPALDGTGIGSAKNVGSGSRLRDGSCL